MVLPCHDPQFLNLFQVSRGKGWKRLCERITPDMAVQGSSTRNDRGKLKQEMTAQDGGDCQTQTRQNMCQ